MPIQLSTDFMLPFRGRYYFAAIFGNGVFSYDFKRENLRLEFRFPYPMPSFRLYKDILSWKDWLIFVPCNAPDIAIYHVDTGELELLPIPERKPRRKTWCQDGYHFWTGVRKGDRAYLVGRGIRESCASICRARISKFWTIGSIWSSGGFTTRIINLMDLKASCAGILRISPSAAWMLC